jgi:hypothetical protein
MYSLFDIRALCQAPSLQSTWCVSPCLSSKTTVTGITYVTKVWTSSRPLVMILMPQDTSSLDFEQPAACDAARIQDPLAHIRHRFWICDCCLDHCRCSNDTPYAGIRSRSPSPWLKDGVKDYRHVDSDETQIRFKLALDSVRFGFFARFVLLEW